MTLKVQVLAAAGDDVTECAICSEPGEFAIDTDSQQSESALLRTTIFFRVVVEKNMLFPTKCVVISSVWSVRFEQWMPVISHPCLLNLSLLQPCTATELNLLVPLLIELDETCLGRWKGRDNFLTFCDLQFACGLCRQLRNTGSLLQEMSCSRPGDAGETAVGLVEHLAMVNGLEDLAEDDSKLLCWAQGILSQSYALQIALRYNYAA